MKLGVPESRELALAVKKFVPSRLDIVVCPSFVSLAEVNKAIKGSGIMLGAQDCFWEPVGAFTGEVSANYLKEVGCEYVILGHSERRKYLGETDAMVHQKVKMALSAGLKPIICVGETFDERQVGSRDYVLINQTTKALEGVDVSIDNQVLIAYEPVWVIGSGQAIDPRDAASAHQVIRQTLFDLFSQTIVNSCFFIIYGGSVDANNISSFIGLENTAGVLVGGASMKAESFKEMINNV